MPDFNTNLGALGPMQANQSQSMSKMSWGPYAEAYEQKFGYNPNLIKAPEEGFTRPSLQEQMEFNSAWDKANPYVAPTFPEGLSHPGGISTMALVNWYNEKTGQRYTANSGGYQAAPGSGWRIVKPTSYEGKIGGGIGEIVSQDPINMPGFVGPTYSAPSTPIAPSSPAAPTLPSVGAKAPSGIPPVPTEVPATQTPSPGALPSTPSYAPTYGALPSTPSYAPTYGALPSTPTIPSVGSTTTGSGKNMAFLDFSTEGAPIPATSAVIDKTTTSTLPDWYSNYAMDLLGKQTNVLNTPYATFQGPRVAGFTPDQMSAFDATRTAATAGQPALSGAVGATSNFLTPGGLNAAQPYLNRAANTSVTGLEQYLNPYTQNVVDRLGDVAGRTLREKLLPAVNDSFISAGQAGSSRNAEILGRTLRDVSESTTAAQRGALQEGYTQALGASNNDLTRQGTLAELIGGLSQKDTATGLSAASQLGSLAEAQQKMGLTGAGALSTIGGQQQGINQQNLDAAMKDFLAQRGYPQAQIDAAMGAISNISKAVPTSERESGITPIPSQGYAPSGLSQFGSALSGAGSLIAGLNEAGAFD